MFKNIEDVNMGQVCDFLRKATKKTIKEMDEACKEMDMHTLAYLLDTLKYRPEIALAYMGQGK